MKKLIKEYCGFAAIIAGFLAVTLSTLSNASIWFDEAFSRYIIRFNFAEIWHYTSVDVHPPLYYFCLKIWSMIFGTSDFAIRSMTVFFAILTLAAIFFLVRRIFGKKAALMATLLTAFSPLMVRYSQEARMYTMIAFFAVMSVRAYYESFIAKNSVKDKKKWRILYIIFICLGMWTQYLSALIPLSIWIFRASQIWPKVRKKSHKFKLFFKDFFADGWLKLHLIAALFFIPWIPFFLIQAIQVKSGFWIPSITFETIPNMISNQLFYLEGWEIDGWLSLVAMAVVIFVVGSIMSRSKHDKFKTNQGFWLLLSMYIFPILMLFALSLPPFSSLFMDRYLLPSAIFFTVLLGVMIVSKYKHQKVLMTIITLLVVCSQIYGIYQVNLQRGFSKTSRKSNETRQALDEAKRKLDIKAGEPIIAENVWLFYEAVQYTDDKNKIYFNDDNVDYKIGSLKMLEDDDTFKIKDLDEFSDKHKTIWLIAKPEGEKQKPLKSSWSLEAEYLRKDSVTGKPLYSVQKYSTKK